MYQPTKNQLSHSKKTKEPLPRILQNTHSQCELRIQSFRGNRFSCDGAFIPLRYQARHIATLSQSLGAAACRRQNFRIDIRIMHRGIKLGTSLRLPNLRERQLAAGGSQNNQLSHCRSIQMFAAGNSCMPTERMNPISVSAWLSSIPLFAAGIGALF